MDHEPQARSPATEVASAEAAAVPVRPSVLGGHCRRRLGRLVVALTDVVRLLLVVLILTSAAFIAGVGFGLGFNVGARPAFDRAERIVKTVEDLVCPRP